VAGDSGGSSGSTSTLLNSPIDLTFDQNGFMYVVDSADNNARVQRFASDSINGTTVAGTTGSHSNAFTDLDKPSALALDNSSNIYVLDMGNTRIMRWAPNATNGTVIISANIINNEFGLLLSPFSSNQVYLTDQGSNSIYVWTFGAPSPNITLTAVNDSHNSLNNPYGIVFDPYGNLYVADTNNNRVVVYCPNSTVGFVIANQSTSGPSSFQHPQGIAFDSNLNLYVTVKDSGLVVKYSRT
jgi:sugar lactone lactonase YvrE